MELQALKERDSEGTIASLRKELDDLRRAHSDWVSKEEAHSDLINKANTSCCKANERQAEQLAKMKRAAQMDESITVGLKKKLETAEVELESLKRKRADSISPERVFTGILKRPAASSPARQDAPSSSAQPTPK